MSFYYNQPEYILAIAAEKNISRAAEKLFVSQSTLTMHLNSVENELGTKLFDRSVRPLKLTEAGMLYLNNLREVRRMEANFLTDLRRILNPQTSFNIGIGPIRSLIYMPALASKLRLSFPEVSINIEEGYDSDLPIKLFNGTVDVIIGCFKADELDFADTFLITNEAILLAAPASFKLKGEKLPLPLPGGREVKRISASSLARLPMIIPSEGTSLCDTAVRLINRHSLQPESVITTRSALTAIEMVSSGIGCALIEYPFLTCMKGSVLSRIELFTVSEIVSTSQPLIFAYSKKNAKQDIISRTKDHFSEVFPPDSEYKTYFTD